MSRRAAVIARKWLGTPYRHQASLRGEGADCLGLIRGVWRELTGTGAEPRMIHAYWGRAVVESWMGGWWRRRLVAVFGWPVSEREDN